ncbi:MAG: hypothetical protein GY729_12430 [Desulfobacteraceae bacterium]|nr:hypothetical protein [Desulfobacteraceae bacterium]
MKTADLHLATDHGGEIQLTMNSTLTGESLTLNTIDIEFDNSSEHGMGALADEVNRYSSFTGIKATAIVETTTSSAIKAGTTGTDFSINGVNIGAVTVYENDFSNALVTAVNDKTAETGVMAAINVDGSLTLGSTDNRSIKVEGSISDVFGNTSGTMSTLGYLGLVKSGVSQFDLEGIGAGATGGSVRLSEDVATVEESVLASGSTINVGSKIAAGSEIGGAAFIESVADDIDFDMTFSAGSALQYSSTLAKDTILGGSVIVSGNTEDNAAAANAVTTIEEDMLLSAGTTLKKHSYLGKGTVITTDFSSGGQSYQLGDVLTARIQLDLDLTLDSNMVLAYDSNTNHNSGLKAGSVLASGSETGTAISIGFTRDDTSAAVSLIASAGGSTISAADLYLSGGDVSISGQYVFQEGSLLAGGSILAIESTGSWSGPTLVTTTGIIEQGDSISNAKLIILEGDQILSEDFSTYDTTAAAQTIKAGSILTTGFQMQDAAGFTSNLFLNAGLESATLSEEMLVKTGSSLQTGTRMNTGSILGSAIYVSGGVNSSDASVGLDIVERSIIKSGSILKIGSTLEEGSTIGGRTLLQNNSNLENDMLLKTGTFLSYGSVIESGSTLSQDMDLYTTNSGNGANIIVNYDANFLADATAMAAFDYAVTIWEGLIDSSVSIEIDANYVDLGGGGALGNASATGSVLGSAITGASQAGARYAMALANSIDGVDHNGGTSEITANFNSNGATNWYFGTDANPGGAEYDFVSVVLHEIGHGLGFYSNVTSSGALTTGAPAIYDYFVEDDAAATGLVFADMNNAQRLDAITSQTVANQITWNGAFGVDAAGGSNPVLYSPDPWEGGSSVSHLDETTYAAGTANGLMTPALTNGEAQHAPGDIALGMLQDMEWKLPSGELVSLKAGDVLTNDMKVGQNGLTLAEDQVLVKGSKVAVNSMLAVNTTNSGSVGLENETTQRLSDLNVLTQKGAQIAIDLADVALKDLDSRRSSLGSVQNQFVSTIANLSVTQVNLKTSESIIRDVDFADEAMNLSRLKIIQQSSSFALGRATASSENVLSLLQ